MKSSELIFINFFANLFPAVRIQIEARREARPFLEEPVWGPPLLTFALSLSRGACFRSGPASREASRTGPPAGRCPVIAMRYGGHFSLK